MRPTTTLTPVTSEPRQLEDATVLEFRTRDGETIVLEGASDDEVRAKANDLLAWAS